MTIFAGDVNRHASCAPRGMWTLTDAAAAQAPGIQHVYGNLAGPRVTVEPATYTDHDAVVVRTRLRRWRGRRPGPPVHGGFRVPRLRPTV
ncbi:hypothetical protein [uncultured Streptomyces sp.]|uniref:hypothetical protein n=1 Tax=uncultured Streptomyces sp. TaxID=174707 RepID=UPI00260F51CB|nr:hypothetical protein [uncultured Streptomyces sp.]